MTKTIKKAQWIEINAERLPLPISGVYARKGNAIVRAEVKEVVCGWDSNARLAYRVTSATGITTQWTPSSRALTSWDPKIVK